MKCAVCHEEIRPGESCLTVGWRDTGTTCEQPHVGATTHATAECQRAYFDND